MFSLCESHAFSATTIALTDPIVLTYTSWSSTQHRMQAQLRQEIFTQLLGAVTLLRSQYIASLLYMKSF